MFEVGENMSIMCDHTAESMQVHLHSSELKLRRRPMSIQTSEVNEKDTSTHLHVLP